MKIRHAAAVAVVLFALVFPPAVPAQAKVGVPERFRKWLDEEVVYIITSHERDVFLHLQTDKERDMFIEAFWKQRDPTPGTPENEYKIDLTKRFDYANKEFHKGAPRDDSFIRD